MALLEQETLAEALQPATAEQSKVEEFWPATNVPLMYHLYAFTAGLSEVSGSEGVPAVQGIVELLKYVPVIDGAVMAGGWFT
jgi:hypothetical protein